MLQPQPSVFVFIYPFALSNFIHTFYTSNDFSLTNSTYKISTSKQGKVLKNIYNAHKAKKFYNFFLYKPVQTSYSFHGSMVESWRLSSARHEAATSHSCRRREAKVHLSDINTRNEVGFKPSPASLARRFSFQ